MSVLEAEMTKVREDLYELQMENARVMLQNETLEREMETLRSINENLQEETRKLLDANWRTVDATRGSDASSVAGARGQPNTDGLSMHAEPRDTNIPGRSAQPVNRSSYIDVSSSGGLSPDVRNRVEGYTNYRKFRLRVLWGRNEPILTTCAFFLLVFSHFFHG
jgi:hypothetical protein